MTPDEWSAGPGALLRQRREALGLSAREAARRAGFSGNTWTCMETGRRVIKGKVVDTINPTSRNLEAAAMTVGLDPDELFAAAGRERPEEPPQLPEPPARRLAAAIEALGDRVYELDRRVRALEEGRR